MPTANSDKRRLERYEKKLNINFRLPINIETKLSYQIMDDEGEKVVTDKYAAVTKNINAEGLYIISNKRLERGFILYLEVHVDGADEVIQMEGEVAWSRQTFSTPRNVKSFDTGVIIRTVDGVAVADSMRYIEEHQIHWSTVLDSLLGQYEKIVKK